MLLSSQNRQCKCKWAGGCFHDCKSAYISPTDERTVKCKWAGVCFHDYKSVSIHHLMIYVERCIQTPRAHRIQVEVIILERESLFSSLYLLHVDHTRSARAKHQAITKQTPSQHQVNPSKHQTNTNQSLSKQMHSFTLNIPFNIVSLYVTMTNGEHFVRNMVL